VCSNALFAQSGNEPKWWKEAIVIKLIRGVLRQRRRGVGDLQGIISNLIILKTLVLLHLLNPIYSSPNDDNGYDVSDYRNIMEDFGTMEDLMHC
jgi:oligo-1,6-glucosidase